MKKTTALQLSGGIVLAAAGLYFFLRDVSVVQLRHDLRSIKATVILLCFALTVISLWLRAIRWKLILPASSAASRKGLFGIVSIGFMVNNFLPARLGEAARMLLLWKRNRFTAAESVGSVLLERVIDSIFFAAFFCVPVFFLPQLRTLVPVAVLFATGTAAACAALLFYGFFPAPARAIVTRLLTLAPGRVRKRLSTVGRELASNLDWMFHPGTCLAVTVLSFCTVATNIAFMIILVHERFFGFMAGMFASASAAIGAAIPLSPGYIGTLHAALKQGLVLCGVDANKAVAAATLYHATGYVTVTLLGLWYFLRMRVSLGEIDRAKAEIEEQETVDEEKGAGRKD